MLSKTKTYITKKLSFISKIFYKLNVKPNHLTVLGLISGLTASILILLNQIQISILFLILACLFDVLDGALARNFNLSTSFGAFLDSVCDRFVDVTILISIGYTFKINYFVITLTILFTLMVSYTRARAECFIEKCDVGVCERSERLILILIGLTFNVINFIIYIILILSIVTVVQRILYTYKKLK